MFLFAKLRILEVNIFCRNCQISSIAIEVFWFCNLSRCSVLFSQWLSKPSISMSWGLVGHLDFFSGVSSSSPSSSNDASSNCHTVEKMNPTTIVPASLVCRPNILYKLRIVSIDIITLYEEDGLKVAKEFTPITNDHQQNSIKTQSQLPYRRLKLETHFW